MTERLLFTKENQWGILSNFAPFPITWMYDDKKYSAPTVEHAFVWAKFYRTNLFYANMCLIAATPGQAKRMGGRNSKAQLDPDWDKLHHRGRMRKVVIMKTLLVRKALQNQAVYHTLLSTDNNELVEYAPWGDRFWGNDKYGAGLNWLGRLWMEVRQEVDKNFFSEENSPEQVEAEITRMRDYEQTFGSASDQAAHDRE